MKRLISCSLHGICAVVMLVIQTLAMVSASATEPFTTNPISTGSPDRKNEVFVGFSPTQSLFAKVYLIDLIFDLDYVEPDETGVSLEGVRVTFSDDQAHAWFEQDLERINGMVSYALTEWNKDEQGLYIMGCSDRREMNLLNMVMGRDGSNDSCHKSFPFCTGTTYNFPAGVNSGSGQQGPNYGCLFTRPNPAWYHMLIGTSGSITITMQSNPLVDIDFICWGPFDHPTDPCVAQLTANKIVDCSYSTAATEVCNIPNAVTGQYYILLITNYSNQPCNISFSQTGGTGTTDCTIVPPPIGNNGPLCIGGTLQLFVLNPIAGSTYAWTGPNNWSSTQQNPVIPNVNMSHAGTYTLVISLFGQTSDPVSTEVQIFPPPNPTISGPQITCQGSSYVYISQNSQPGNTFNWVVTGGEVINGQGTSMATVKWTTYGAGTVRVTENSPWCGPVTSPWLNVSISPLPFAPATPTGQGLVCQGMSGVQYTTSGSSNSLSYIWSLQPPEAGNINGTGTTAVVNWSGLYSGTASIAVAGENDCGLGSPSQALDVIVGAAPDADAGDDSTIPHGSSTTLYGTATGGNPPYAYSWSPPELLVNPNVQNPQTVNLFQPTVFTLTVNDNGSCTASDEVIITLSGGALSVLVGADHNAVCYGSSTQLSAIPGGGSGNYTYSWVSEPPGFTSNEQNPYVTPNQSTFYAVTVDDGYNNAYGDIFITVNQLPTAHAGANQSIPHGASTTLNGSGSGGTPSYSYAWEPAALLINPNSNTTATVNLYETTTFYLTVTDSNGCVSDINSVEVIVSGNALWSDPYAFPALVCPGSNTQLFANPSGGSQNYTCEWTSDPPGFTSGEQNPVVFPSGPTIYYVTVNDGFNTHTGSIFIDYAALPSADFTFDTVCHGTLTTLADRSMITEGSIETLIWFSNGAVIGFGPDLNYVFPQYGDNIVTLTAISEKDCENSITKNIYVKRLPVIDLFRRIPADQLYLSSSGDTLYACVYNSVTLDAGDPDKPHQLFSWSVGAESDTLLIGALGVGYELQYHRVVVTDTISGCVNVAEILIQFSVATCELSVQQHTLAHPFVFYPNPASDVLFIEYQTEAGETGIEFYNLYGQLIKSEQIFPVHGSIHQLDIKGLNAGIYFLRFNNSSLVRTVKLIKSRH